MQNSQQKEDKFAKSEFTFRNLAKSAKEAEKASEKAFQPLFANVSDVEKPVDQSDCTPPDPVQNPEANDG